MIATRMKLKGSAMTRVACWRMVMPPAMSMAMVSTPVRVAQKIRSHGAASSLSPLIRLDRLDMTSAPESALVT